MDHFRPLYLYLRIFKITNRTNSMLSYFTDGIWTTNLCCWKELLNQLIHHHGHCPTTSLTINEEPQHSSQRISINHLIYSSLKELRDSFFIAWYVKINFSGHSRNKFCWLNISRSSDLGLFVLWAKFVSFVVLRPLKKANMLGIEVEWASFSKPWMSLSL